MIIQILDDNNNLLCTVDSLELCRLLMFHRRLKIIEPGTALVILAENCNGVLREQFKLLISDSWPKGLG